MTSQPELIGKYEIVSELGKGSMGVVYQGRDPEIGRLVAIKTLRTVYLGDGDENSEAVKRFRTESRSAGRLRHANIVTIFEAGRGADGVPFIVMEFIEGQSLEQHIRTRGALNPREATHYLAQIASAIDYAHSQNVIHRDIKPSNVIIDRSYKPHLLDFGVAKLNDTSVTPAGTVVGTPSYMSPEQIKGLPLTGASDRFALAVMAFEMYTGQRPFPGKDFTTVVNNIIHKEPLTFQELGIGLNPALEAVLQKGLSKEPTTRHASALEFVSELAKTLNVMVDGMGIVGGYVPSEEDVTQTVRTPPPSFSAPPQPVHVPPPPPPPPPPPVEPPVSDLRSNSGPVPNAVIPEMAPSKTSVLPALLVALGLIAAVLGAGYYLYQQTLNADDASRIASEDEAADEPSPISPPVQQEPPVQLAPTLESDEVAQEIPVAVSAPVSSAVTVVAPGFAPKAPVNGIERLAPADVAGLSDEELVYVLQREGTSDDILRAALDEASRRERSEIRQAIGFLTTHPNFVVRINALKALSGEKHRTFPEVKRRAIERLNDEDFLVRGFAGKLLLQLAGTSGDPTVRAALQARLLMEENDKVKQVLSQALEKLPPS